MQTSNINNELMLDICENASALIAYHDLQQRIMWANKAYRQALGVSMDELDGHACYQLWGLKRRCQDCPVTKTITTGEPAEAELTPVTQIDWPEEQGSWLVRSAPIWDENGSIVGAVETAFEITERKKAEDERLEESEERYRGIFEQAGDGILLMDCYGNIKDCNPAACFMLEYDKEDLLRTNYTHIISSESLAEQAFPPEDISVGELVHLERELLCKSGSRRTMEKSLVELHTGDLLLMLRDITKRAREKNRRQKLLKELEDREALLRAIFENAPGGIVVCDGKARITMTNPAADKLYSRPVPFGKEIGSHSQLKILRKDDTPYDPQELPLSRSALRGEYCHHEEVRIQWPQGQKRWLLVNTAPILRERGGQNGAVGLIQDITDRKKNEQALCESEQRFRQLFEQAAIGIFIVSKDFTIIEANQTALDILGYSKEELLQMSGENLINPEDLEKLSVGTAANKLLSGEEVNIERRYRLKGGGYIHVLVSSARMPYYSEKASHMIMFQDISERKRMEEQLREMSFYDSLTGLYNRNFFDLEMERLSDKRYLPVGIVVCDFDGLKFINDTLGHSSGDEMLSNVADILRQCIRSSEIVARIGGDEFAILLTRIDEDIVNRLVQRLRRQAENFNARNRGIPVSLSIGYAVGSTEGTDMEVLFREADNRMYREKIQKEQSSRNAIVQGLIKAVEARDFLTEGHCERLQEFVVSLAQEIGLLEDRINDLRLFARFHDLGKVGIHDEILFKPESLTQDEFLEMRKHSEVGHRIAKSLYDLAPIADWILKHHERWDGLGYPFGLKGRDIPLECRILAVADAFDVMTSDRPYQNAISHYEAVQELRRCAGTQFDPNLVEKFIQILDINDTD